MDLPRTPSLRLDGRRALVAGASSGIGLGCAVALAEAGAHVILAARKQARLEAAEHAIDQAGFSCESLVLDIADVDAIRQGVASCGVIDVMVNSAGLARHSAALDTKVEDYDAVVAVNMKGAHFLAVATARSMIASRRAGSIVTISSQMGHVGGQDRSVYAATKHAVEGMTRSMAIEWGQHGIRVNSICPTFIRTQLTEPTFADPERVAWIESKIKLGRVGRVEDIMGPVVFLASDASALVTGTCLLVDGGWTAG